MKIEDFKNRQPFTVPENYFEQFTGNMMNLLPKEGAKEQKKHRTIALPRKARQDPAFECAPVCCLP
mgnify:CR=1 FL=1